MGLRGELIKLAHAKPELRKHSDPGYYGQSPSQLLFDFYKKNPYRIEVLYYPEG